MAVEDLLLAAGPDRHLAAGRSRGPAADRRVEHVKVFLGEGGVDLAPIATELVDISKKALSGRMPSINLFGPSAACSTSDGTGNEVKTISVCARYQVWKRPSSRSGRVRDKAGYRE